ncbi:unnamed protein product [Linum tenue]|uniref:Uncharacterized protein n=1 Tax=Linum tenue TaxID=586396 RepID=A0AAV0IXF0_9ROSI|nr:unnamed protein product [Linum tenue]
MVTVRMIDITVNFTDGMFRGTYNGKQHHVADIPAVLTRAWNASLSSGMKIFAFDFSCSVWSSPNMFAIEYLSVASRKFLLPTVSSVGLAIAETDGLSLLILLKLIEGSFWRVGCSTLISITFYREAFLYCWNLKKVGIRRTISKLCCRWPKKEFGKERY